jgi:hypothetical protein
VPISWKNRLQEVVRPSAHSVSECAPGMRPTVDGKRWLIVGGRSLWAWVRRLFGQTRGDLLAGGELELFEDLFHVVVNRALGDEELGGDLAVG